MKPLVALPLPDQPVFGDLIFRPHPDGMPGHLQALHKVAGGFVSVIRGGYNYGTSEAPYEMQTPDGEIHAPLTALEIELILRALGQRAPD